MHPNNVQRRIWWALPGSIESYRNSEKEGMISSGLEDEEGLLEMVVREDNILPGENGMRKGTKMVSKPYSS